MHDSAIDSDEWRSCSKVVVVPYRIVIYVDSHTRDVTDKLNEGAQIIVNIWAHHKVLLMPIVWEGIVGDRGLHEARIVVIKSHIVVLDVN